MLNDNTCGVDSTGKNRIGMNSDPSNKALFIYGQAQSYTVTNSAWD